MSKTIQEDFWAGSFGDEYINRNMDIELVASNIALFSRIIKSTNNVNSIMEFGPNIGMNLIALKNIKPSASYSAVEINKKAATTLSEIKDIEVINKSILDFNTDKRWDLVFTKGVLIHINPEELRQVYEKMYNFSEKYILMVEYYNPSPVSIEYRGETDRLFKRDFAGEMLDMYDDLVLVDYGFAYKRDSNFKQDDVTWFLMKKTK